MNYALGIDIGVNSIGWALLELNSEKAPCRLIRMNSRIFEPGMKIDEKNGKAESRAAERRNKRALRRILARRRKRIAKLRHLLQAHGMLPPEEDFGNAVSRFDTAEIEKFKASGATGLPNALLLPHVLPYYLRERCLDYPVSPMEFGRAIYHLAQRRGFLSNRKAAARESDEEKSIVKTSIADIRREMAAAKARTLGEYFCKLDPAKEKIRRQWTARDMYEDEFKLICERQQNLLTPELQSLLHRAIFYQRPLKSVKNLIGSCELEPRARRCAWDRPEAQEFRILQEVNHLQIIDADKNQRGLTQEERTALLCALNGISGKLDSKGDLTFANCRKLFGLPRSSKFSPELGGEKRLPGNRINHRLTQILGKRWVDGSDEFKEAILQELRSIGNPEALKRRMTDFYKLPPETAQELSEYILPEGYCSLSLRAIRRLLPAMREGLSYSEAVKKIYPETFRNNGKALDRLPGLDDLKNLRNPLVKRIMGECRKVVNAIIDEYGKPEIIRIELARDVKNSAKERQRIIKRNREQETRRRRIYETIIADKTLGISSPKRSDVEKVMLAEECKWTCPYTGKPIDLRSLLRESQFDIEHIIPYSRSMDDSMANKTLCLHSENRFVKKNYTPYEAYAAQPEKYEQILRRVAGFDSPEELVAEKLRRFKIKSEAELSGFCDRMLNDTKYAAKLMKQYLGSLYGGEVDSDGRRRVQACNGRLTSLVRSVCGFNRVLGSENKNRGDHRHHAVDAVAIALVEPELVNMVSRYFSDPEAEFKAVRFYDNLRKALDFPAWPNMIAELREKSVDMLTSHLVRNRLRGPLHNETIYGKERGSEGDKIYRHARMPLEKLTEKDIGKIVDHAIRKLVSARLDELKAKDGSVFKAPENLPLFNGIPVRRVRVAINKNTMPVGQGDRRRDVDPANNHHMELVDVIDEAGKIIRQEGYVVSLFEALRRKHAGEPVVRKSFPDLTHKGRTLKQHYRMMLCNGDIIRTVEDDDSEPQYRIIRTIPQSKQIVYVPINDARPIKEIRADGKMNTAVPGTLMAKFHGKFMVNYLGELRRNNA